MRPSLSRYAAVAAAIFVTLVMVGCATDNGDAEDPTELPADESPAKERKSDDTKPPEFDADFDNSGDTGRNDGDPTPPDGDQCIDNDDPGSAENVAKVLPSTTDCDDHPNNNQTVSGVAKGAVDVDFYKLSMTDAYFCSVGADFEGQTAGTELCVYARCKNSTIDAVTGCEKNAGTLSTSDIGMKGCCTAAPGHAVPKWDCSGFTDDDSADFFIRVRQINGDKCLPYTFRYKF